MYIHVQSIGHPNPLFFQLEFWHGFWRFLSFVFFKKAKFAGHRGVEAQGFFFAWVVSYSMIERRDQRGKKQVTLLQNRPFIGIFFLFSVPFWETFFFLLFFCSSSFTSYPESTIKLGNMERKKKKRIKNLTYWALIWSKKRKEKNAVKSMCVFVCEFFFSLSWTWFKT